MSQKVLAEEIVRNYYTCQNTEGLLAGLGTLLFQPTANSFQILFQHSGPSPDVRFHQVRNRSHGNCILVDISSLIWSAPLDVVKQLYLPKVIRKFVNAIKSHEWRARLLVTLHQRTCKA